MRLRVLEAEDDLGVRKRRQGRERLLDVLRTDAQVAQSISEDDLGTLFEPQKSFGSAPAMMERVLAAWATSRGSAP